MKCSLFLSSYYLSFSFLYFFYSSIISFISFWNFSLYFFPYCVRIYRFIIDFLSIFSYCFPYLFLVFFTITLPLSAIPIKFHTERTGKITPICILWFLIDHIKNIRTFYHLKHAGRKSDVSTFLYSFLIFFSYLFLFFSYLFLFCSLWIPPSMIEY